MVARFLLLLLAIMASAVVPAAAHEIRPAYLQIHEIEPSTYDIMWKTPAQGDMRLALNVILPPGCHNLGLPRMTPVDGAVIQRWRSVCEGGLLGKRIVIENLETSLTDVIVRFEPLTGSPKMLRINGSDPYAVIPARQSFWDVAGSYLGLGVEHIVFGLDHLLFVLGLLLIVRDRWMLLKTVSAFTLAHSITLAAATLGLISLSIPLLNALIALSILFVAPEAVRAQQGGTSLTIRYPWVVAFVFGLLHGMGFASGLTSLGLEKTALIGALVFFNVGVEIGQLLFIALVLALRRAFRLMHIEWPRPVALAPTYAIGILGATWTLQYSAILFGAS